MPVVPKYIIAILEPCVRLGNSENYRPWDLLDSSTT
jgi:hypothetical protein